MSSYSFFISFDGLIRISHTARPEEERTPARYKRTGGARLDCAPCLHYGETRQSWEEEFSQGKVWLSCDWNHVIWDCETYESSLISGVCLSVNVINAPCPITASLNDDIFSQEVNSMKNKLFTILPGCALFKYCSSTGCHKSVLSFSVSLWKVMILCVFLLTVFLLNVRVFFTECVCDVFFLLIY